MFRSPRACAACGFENPRAWKICCQCGAPTASRLASAESGGGREAAHVDELSAASPPLAMVSRLDELMPPLFGQGRISASVHEALDASIRGRAGTYVSIEGARGSGKTRLLVHASEVLARTHPAARVVYATCRGDGSDGHFAPFGRALLERFEVDPSSSDAAVRGAIAAHVGQVLEGADAIGVAETAHLLGYIAGVPFPDSPFIRESEGPLEIRGRAVEAFRRFVAADASKRPWLLLLDDMGAAEDDAWALVTAALDADASVCAVLTGGVGLGERLPPALRQRQGSSCSVEPLTEAEIEALLQVLLPDLVEAPEALVAALTHRSRGNPSALRELVHALVEGGLFVETKQGFLADLSKLETGQLPLSLEDAIRARLDRLDPLERATLDRASVMGEAFMDRCVLALTRSERALPGDERDASSHWPHDDDERELGAALERLVEKGFLARVRSEVPGVGELRFMHTDTRALVYEEQDAALRLARHGVVAEWLSVVAEAHRAGIAARAAPHLERAGMHGRAGRAYLEAAHDEEARLHTQTALRHVEKALELIETGDLARRIDALHLAGSLLTTLGRYDEARAHFEEMLRLAWRIGARNKGGAALNRIARLHRQRGEDAQAAALLERALTLFRDVGDLRGVASSLDDLAQVARLRGDLERALLAASEALEIRRSHADARGEAVSLMTLGSIELARGDLGSAERFFHGAREIRESLVDRVGVVQTYNALGAVAFDRGDHERAEGYWRAALQEARKMADRHTQSFLLNNLGEALLEANRVEDARALLREARELAQSLGNRRAIAEIERNLGLAAMRAGDDDAERVLLRALALAVEYGSSEAIGLAHRAVGQLRARTLFDADGGLSRRAEESFLMSIDLLREVGNEKEAARSLALLGSHLIERGDLDTARERLHEARAIMRRIGLGRLREVERTLAEIGE